MPTIQSIPGPYRFFFYSFDCNEPMHVHAERESSACKFWLEPLMLASNHGFVAHELGRILGLIRMHRRKIEDAWHEHCP
ncbi:MAG: DUF4160 domain-containing protein [Gemmatimonadetes bacterium]|nr:DUF4160 domain-containing protein [Gemmatimonadota bacterium]